MFTLCGEGIKEDTRPRSSWPQPNPAGWRAWETKGPGWANTLWTKLLDRSGWPKEMKEAAGLDRREAGTPASGLAHLYWEVTMKPSASPWPSLTWRPARAATLHRIMGSGQGCSGQGKALHGPRGPSGGPRQLDGREAGCWPAVRTMYSWTCPYEIEQGGQQGLRGRGPRWAHCLPMASCFDATAKQPKPVAHGHCDVSR